MTEIKKTKDELLADIGLIKPGRCPDFYLEGRSASILEKTGLELAGTIRKRNLISFKGLTETFTILMPYFDDSKGADQFLEHIKNSVSIAQDCYDCFRGIILMEMDGKWGENGFNKSLLKIFDYIRDNEQICFIVLALTVGNGRAAGEIYNELRAYGTWWRAKLLSPSLEQCISSFEKSAVKRGYFLTEGAKKILSVSLGKRAEDTIDNMEVLDNLLQQILFEHSLDSDSANIIDIEDVAYLGKMAKRDLSSRIGFKTECGREGE